MQTSTWHLYHNLKHKRPHLYFSLGEDLDVFVDTADCRRRHFGHLPHPPRIQHGWQRLENGQPSQIKIGKNTFGRLASGMSAAMMSLGASKQAREKQQGSLFLFVSQVSPPLLPPFNPNPLCRPAGKGRPAAKSRIAGKIRCLPSGSGGVTHSFVLPEALIQTQIFMVRLDHCQPEVLPTCHLPSLHLTLRLFCFYTLTLGFLFCHTAIQTFAPNPHPPGSIARTCSPQLMPAASCQPVISCHSDRERRSSGASEPARNND